MRTDTVPDKLIRINLGGLVLSVIMPVILPASSSGGMVGIHYHSCMEIHVVQAGALRLYAQGCEYELPEGACCLLGTNVYHYLKPVDDAAKIKRFAMLFECRLKKNADSEARALFDILTAARVVPFGNSRNVGCFLDIAREITSPEAGSRPLLESLFTQIIISAARAAGGSGIRASSAHEGTIDDFRDHIISDYFCDNLKEDLTPEMLAREISVSPRHLCRIIRRLFGKPFKEVLIDTRIEAAKDLLLNTEKKVSGISEEVGYRQPSNFYRIFHERTGMTPLQFRKANRKDFTVQK